jgi:cysteine desulfurase
LLHVDAVQAVGKIPVHFHDLGAASLALGAHKFYGPRGIGALLLRRGLKLAPSAFGGHQEAGRRPGTEVVPLIAGMARALELFAADREQRIAHTRVLRDLLEQRLAALCPPVVLNGSRERRLPNTLNLAFPGADGEALLVALDLEGVACSLGSTCASGSAEPSPVLLAMNRPKDVWHSSVRFSTGIDTTREEIEQAAQIISQIVTRLRASSAVRA